MIPVDHFAGKQFLLSVCDSRSGSSNVQTTGGDILDITANSAAYLS